MKYLMPRAGELAQVNSARAIVVDHLCTIFSLLKSQATTAEQGEPEMKDRATTVLMKRLLPQTHVKITCTSHTKLATRQKPRREVTVQEAPAVVTHMVQPQSRNKQSSKSMHLGQRLAVYQNESPKPHS
jgi:hypothetical protein